MHRALDNAGKGASVYLPRPCIADKNRIQSIFAPTEGRSWTIRPPREHVMKTKLFGSICIIVGMALVGVPQASATPVTPITYDLTSLTLGTFSLTGGYITTDGAIGSLASTDIMAWSVTITGGSPSRYLHRIRTH
jgi:hypothetical protein